jgi:hypothetical protein
MYNESLQDIALQIGDYVAVRRQFAYGISEPFTPYRESFWVGVKAYPTDTVYTIFSHINMNADKLYIAGHKKTRHGTLKGALLDIIARRELDEYGDYDEY